jgi:hypothetical protein
MRPHVSGDNVRLNSITTRVVRQIPRPGVAAAPGMAVTLFVKGG